MKYWVFLFTALLVNSAANIILKKGAQEPAVLSSAAPNGGLIGTLLSFLNISTIVAILLFACNIVFYRKALSRIPLSVAYPIMTSLGFVIVVVFSALFYQESMSWTKVIGLICILAGVVLVSLK
jgi:multidrug transporter EmrE-like cation transporter